MISFCGITLLIKYFYQSSQCFRYNSILFVSVPSFLKRIVKNSLLSLSHLYSFVHILNYFFNLFLVCVGYFVWNSTITFLKVPPGHLFSLLLALFSS